MPLLKSILSFTLFIAIGLLAGLGAQSLYQRWHRPAAVTVGDFNELHRQFGAEVVLFGTSSCPYCREARALLNEHAVPFRDLLIDESPAAGEWFRSMGESGVPVLVAGDQLIRGFNAEQYQRVANRLGQTSKHGATLSTQ